MRSHVGTVLAAFVVLYGVADAQVVVEGGGGGIAADEAVSFDTQASGVYFAGNVHMPGADWLSVFVGASIFEDTGTLGQAGLGVRLSSADSLARPVFRGGATFSEGDSLATIGIALYVGRAVGGQFILDYGARDGVTFTILHFGGYYSFGGG